MAHLIIKTVIFTFLVPCSVAVIGPWVLTGGITLAGQWSMLLGFLLMGIACILYSWCVWDFMAFGKGTPAPIEAPKYLVIKGLYRYIRNPMYVSVLCFIFGWLLLFPDGVILLYLMCIAVCLQMLVVFYEEPILHKTFGKDYLQYKNSVNRWLPKLDFQND